MNSIEIAKKLIEENDESIEICRESEVEYRRRIAELKQQIKDQKKVLDKLESDLARQEEWLASTQADKKVFLVDNLALKMFIAEGGGLDMCVD